MSGATDPPHLAQEAAEVHPRAARQRGRSLGRTLSGLALGFGLTALAGNLLLDRGGWNLFAGLVGSERGERIVAYAERASELEVLFLGSSRVDDGFLADEARRQLGQRLQREVRLHKLGVPGLEPRLLAEVLERIVRHRPPADLLVIGVESRYFAARYGEQGAALQTRSWDPPEPTWMRGLRGWSGLLRLLDPRVGARIAQLVQDAGDLPGASPAKPPTPRRARSARTERPFLWVWNPEHHPSFAAWERLLGVARELPCEVVFVRMPVEAGYLQGRAAELERRFQERILAGLAERGLTYLDLAQPPYPARQHDFTNPTHLNRAGARAFTRDFVQRELAPRLALDPAGDS